MISVVCDIVSPVVLSSPDHMTCPTNQIISPEARKTKESVRGSIRTQEEYALRNMRLFRLFWIGGIVHVKNCLIMNDFY